MGWDIELTRRAQELLPGARQLEVRPRNGNFFNWPYARLNLGPGVAQEFYQQALRAAVENLADWADPSEEGPAAYAAQAFVERAALVPVSESGCNVVPRELVLSVEEVQALIEGELARCG